jgi:hypothetical protein
MIYKDILNKLYENFNKPNITRLDSINNMIYLIIVYVFNVNYGIDIDQDNIKYKLLEIKNELTTKNLINFNMEIITSSTHHLINDIFTFNKQLITSKNMINSIYLYHLQHDTQLKIKEYERYYNNILLTEYVVNLCKPSHQDKIFDGNMRVNSYLDYSIQYIKKSDPINIDNLYGSCENESIRCMLNNSMYINSDYTTSFDKNLLACDVLTNDIIINGAPGMFDVMYFNTISYKHNIIHANSCNRIKQFKIRGTNYESLIVQLIMASLNKNGKCCIVVPDSFLYSDSNQIVETRKHLLERFNVVKIIQLNDMNYIKGLKYSLIYFENTVSTSNVKMLSISSKDDKIKEDELFTIDYTLIKENNYSLYNKIYADKKNTNQLEKYQSINIMQVVEFYTENIDISNQYVLSIDKYYNNINSIKLTTSDKITNFNIILTEKTNDIFIPQFVLYYLDYLFKNKIQSYLSGKLNLINIDKIKTIEIPILSKEQQLVIDSYYSNSNKIYNYNIEKINSYAELKRNVFILLDCNNIIRLEKIARVESNTTIVEKYKTHTFPLLIGVMKNSMMAGTVSLLENVSLNNNVLSNNMHYLIIKDEAILFVYYYLQSIEKKIKELAQLTAKPNLSVGQLHSILIPVVEETVQLNLVDYCKSFDENIIKLTQDNNIIKDKDIMSIISRVYNF